MKMLEMIDTCICKYLGLGEQKINSNSLIKIGNKMILANTEPFKRHLHYTDLHQFLSKYDTEIDECERQRIGASMGEVLAEDLVVSFEKISIRKEEYHV